jgi:hypothetical protein
VIDITFNNSSGINFTRSIDNGATFSTPTAAVPFNDATGVHLFDMQLDSAGDVIILAQYTIDEVDDETSISKSTDGQTFTTTVINDSHSIEPTMIVEPSGAIDVAWLGDGGTSSTLQEMRSTDGGTTFSTPQTVWTGANDAIVLVPAGGPQGQVYLTWIHEDDLQCDVLFTASLDGSQTFSTPQQLSTASGCNANIMPVIDTAGNVNITWENGQTLFFTRSADQGQTFAALTSLSGNPEGLAVDQNGNILIVLGQTLSGGNQGVFLSRSTDQGQTFSTPTQLSLPPVANFGGGNSAVIAIDASNKVSVVWIDDGNGSFDGDDDIFLTTSTDGINFSAPMQLSNLPGQIEDEAQLALSPAGVRYVVWEDSGTTLTPQNTVYFEVKK